jgi:glycosyltransferase involved in cell wall biosynthesis
MKTVDGVRILLHPRLSDIAVGEMPAHIMRGFLNAYVGLSKFDIVHSSNVGCPTTALPVPAYKIIQALRLRDYKIFVDWDDTWGRDGLMRFTHRGKIMEMMATILEEKVPLCADHVTVVSETIRQRALSVGIKPEKITQIPNGANVEGIKPQPMLQARKRLGLPNDKKILCFVGSMLMSFDLLLRTLQIVIRRFPNTSLLLVSPLKANHLRRIATLNLTKEVIPIGVQPYENIPLYLGASDILLLPRANNFIERANFPSRLMDYLAAGRPVVATAIGEVERVIRESNGGLLTAPDNPEDFANKIIELMENPQLCDELGKNAREAAENKFSWQIVTKKLEKVYINVSKT